MNMWDVGVFVKYVFRLSEKSRDGSISYFPIRQSYLIDHTVSIRKKCIEIVRDIEYLIKCFGTDIVSYRYDVIKEVMSLPIIFEMHAQLSHEEPVFQPLFEREYLMIISIDMRENVERRLIIGQSI